MFEQHTFELHTSSAAETKAVAAALAAAARPGDLLLLSGDLGAGKTTFTQGYARALGVTEAVTSPTFTLHRRYRGRLTLHHLDVYRLGGKAEELDDLDLGALLEDEAVTLVEWGDTISALLPSPRLEVRLVLGTGDDDRVVHILGAADLGPGRELEIRRLLAPFSPPSGARSRPSIGGCAAAPVATPC